MSKTSTKSNRPKSQRRSQRASKPVRRAKTTPAANIEPKLIEDQAPLLFQAGEEFIRWETAMMKPEELGGYQTALSLVAILINKMAHRSRNVEWGATNDANEAARLKRSK